MDGATQLHAVTVQQMGCSNLLLSHLRLGEQGGNIGKYDNITNSFHKNIKSI